MGKVRYLDACVFLALIKNEANRAEHVATLLDEALDGKLEVVTSALSITEAANGVAIIGGKRDAANEAKIDGLFAPGSPVQVVEIYRAIAEDARDLLRQAVDDQRKLTPPDAIHLATARRLCVDELHTYDPAVAKWAEGLGISVSEPMPLQPKIPPASAP